MIKELVQATGAPELLLSTQHRSGAPVSAIASQVLPLLHETLSTCPDLPDTSAAQIMPLDVFLSQEVSGYKQLVAQVQVNGGDSYLSTIMTIHLSFFFLGWGNQSRS